MSSTLEFGCFENWGLEAQDKFNTIEQGPGIHPFVARFRVPIGRHVSKQGLPEVRHRLRGLVRPFQLKLDRQGQRAHLLRTPCLEL